MKDVMWLIEQKNILYQYKVIYYDNGLDGKQSTTVMEWSSYVIAESPEDAIHKIREFYPSARQLLLLKLEAFSDVIVDGKTG